VIGSLPLGATSPNRIRPSAVPPAIPGYQAMRTAGAIEYQAPTSGQAAKHRALASASASAAGNGGPCGGS